MQVWNPSFDVTPASLITGIITEAGLVRKIDGTSFDVPGILGLENGIKPDSADSGSSIPGFYALDLGSVKTYLADRPSLCAHLGDKDSVDQWQVINHHDDVHKLQSPSTDSLIGLIQAFGLSLCQQSGLIATTSTDLAVNYFLKVCEPHGRLGLVQTYILGVIDCGHFVKADEL